MRAIIFAAIVLLVSFGAHAQEEQPQRPQRPQMQLPDTVVLDIVIVTPKDKPDMHHRLEFPKDMTRDEQIDACAAELARFLKHKFPVPGAQAKVATCIEPLNIKEEDS